MERFKKVYKQEKNDVDKFEIWVDTVTGINYLYHREGNSGGLTPLLDNGGNPVVTRLKLI
ncbi:DUF6440 family protein [Faecalicatena fissicatena]|uniref:Xylan 1,4-beta-xylosidase n=1 Tax=Faecalicatena fissicatena TaxID=290055 RepID=A0ABS2ECE4_9FIRM|nr:DUF6440 family protein [Faecalicatena fissicatena]MBM6739306.1 xylan 1,4-beta-xylosidase [Faecalicatena fissicatena]